MLIIVKNKFVKYYFKSDLENVALYGISNKIILTFRFYFLDKILG